MKLNPNVWVGLLVTGVVAGRGVTAQEPLRSVTPTKLEAFVAEPGVRTAWSKFVGRIDGKTASAIVTAVASVSEVTPGRTMRGVRIELRHEGARPDCDRKYLEWSVMCARENAAVYIEEDRLETFRRQVLQGRAEVHPGHPMGVSTFFGSATGGGILISGYLLYESTLEDLATILSEAAKQLQSAPR